MKATTRTKTRTRATATVTTIATTTASNNLFSALSLVSLSDSETDSVYTTRYLPETDSDLANADQEMYQTRLLEDCRKIEEQLRYYLQEETDSDNNWKGGNEEEIMIITPEALKALCSSTLTPFHQYDTVQIRSVKQSIINGLMRVTCETHNHGHAVILVTEDHFRPRTGDPEAELPKAPTRPDMDLRGKNYKKYHWELKLYKLYMETGRATTELLKEIFPNSFVGLEVTYEKLPLTSNQEKHLIIS